jgi:hypothetical protein
MNRGTRFFVASSLLAAGLGLPVIASGDEHEKGEGSESCACASGCGCGEANAANPSGDVVVRLESGKPKKAKAKAKKGEPREKASPRARAEELGLWLHGWAEDHPKLAEMGPKLLMLREFHPSKYLKALDDLPGPARRDVVRAMDRLAEYERLLAKHPDDYRDFVHEHFPERWEHMMHLWGSPAPAGGEHAAPHGGPGPRVPPPHLQAPRPPKREEREEDEEMEEGRDEGPVFELRMPDRHPDHEEADEDEDEDGEHGAI